MSAARTDPRPPGPLPDAEATLAALAERMRGAVAHDAAFVGIYSGGAWIAERLAQRWCPATMRSASSTSRSIATTTAARASSRTARRTELPFDVEGATIVLVDDVLYTGRSVRAAINELFDFGRPGARSSSPCWSTAAAASCRSSRPTPARGSRSRATCRSCCRATPTASSSLGVERER